MVQASSGNLFWRYGGQEYIVDKYDPNGAWTIALAGNSFIAVVDLASIFIDFKKVTGIDDSGYLTAQFKALSKALSSRLADGRLGSDEFLGMIVISVKSVVTTAFSKMLERAVNQGIIATFSATAGAVLSSSFNVFKKIASGLQVVERSGGLLLPGRLAVERSVMVIGDPFPPVIGEMSPQSARKNSVVSITGRNFPNFRAMLVDFCVFPEGAAENAEPLKTLAATVVSKSANTVVVKVPANFESLFGESDHVVVRVTDGMKKGDSRPLGSAGLFHYVGAKRN